MVKLVPTLPYLYFAMRIGLISDTHGLIREEALAFLWGCERIIHAGDIGSPEILNMLATIAPVVAVRGNNDTGPWAAALPETLRLQVEFASIYVLHDLAQLDFEPAGAGISVVICGHSHRSVVQRRDGVLYINPGSAGPRRFSLPISIGELIVANDTLTPRIALLDVAGAGRRKSRKAGNQQSLME